MSAIASLEKSQKWSKTGRRRESALFMLRCDRTPGHVDLISTFEMYSRIGDPKKMGEDYVCPGNFISPEQGEQDR
jgi:hypothetical protein